MLRDRGAQRIIVGDRGTAFFGEGTQSNMQKNGIAAAASKIGIEIQYWDSAGPGDLIKVPKNKATHWDSFVSPGFSYPKILSEVDHIINLPCMKTHYLGYYTMALKNWIGITTAGDRQANLISHTMPKLAQQIAEIHMAVTPSFNILDATKALIQGGPKPSDPPGPMVVDAGYVIASHDRVALDVTGLAILKLLGSPSAKIKNLGIWKQPQIIAAVERNLGIVSPDEYEIGGNEVDRLDEIRDLVRNG